MDSSVRPAPHSLLAHKSASCCGRYPLALPALADDLTSIVVRGEFGRENLSPRRLYEQKLIGETEYADSIIEVRIPDQVSVFQAGWLRCDINPAAMQLSTKDEAEQERLRDLAAAILRSLESVKISQLGLNRHVHFPAPDPAEYDAIGDNLVHNDVWNDILIAPGMRSSVFWGQRTDQYSGRIQIQVEPSFSVSYGVYFSYNDHYDLTRVETQPVNRAEVRALARQDNTDLSIEKIDVAVEILNEEWQSFITRNNAALERVWSLRRRIQ
jgi:hypothetical protein